MLRPSGSIVLPFKIKKASLALRIESLFEKTFSMGISCMSLAVWLGEDRKVPKVLTFAKKHTDLFICTVLSAILLFLVYFTLFLFHSTLSISLPLRISGITQNTAITTYKTLPNVISHCT